jgi:hypothetical protein
MAPAELEAAQTRYVAAYEAYQKAAKLVAQALKDGRLPSIAEVEEEGKAIEQLAIARRHLLDVMARLAPPRH